MKYDVGLDMKSGCEVDQDIVDILDNQGHDRVTTTFTALQTVVTTHSSM
jgi:hypothetical protein